MLPETGDSAELTARPEVGFHHWFSETQETHLKGGGDCRSPGGRGAQSQRWTRAKRRAPP